MLSLADIITKYSVSVHCYADDTQLYVSVKPNDLSQLHNLETCFLSERKRWMGMNFLQENTDKTELLVVRPANHEQ